MTKTTVAKPKEKPEVVESYETGVLSEEEVKARFVEKVARGDFTFPEDMVRGLAVALGVDEELPDDFYGRGEPPSRTAGGTTTSKEDE